MPATRFTKRVRSPLVSLALLTIVSDGTAAETVPKPEKVRVTKAAPDKWQIETRHASLSDVLAAVAAHTGASFHYSSLPEEFVSFNCAGASAKALLECVMGPEWTIDDHDPAAPRSAGQPARANANKDLWLSTSKPPDKTPPVKISNAAACKSPGDDGSAKTSADGLAKSAKPAGLAGSQVDKLAKKIAGTDSAERLSAISTLAAQGKPGDEKVHQTLETALTDQDAGIRAQAVYGLSREGGVSGLRVLQDAMADGDADVRLMAVDSAGTDSLSLELLKTAVNDSDPTVAAAARLKLDATSSSPEGGP